FKNVRDPQCAGVAANIQSLCTLQAVADAKNGQVVLQNPAPGTRGNVGLNTLEYAGTWRVDMALAKRLRIRENLRGTIRMDANYAQDAHQEFFDASLWRNSRNPRLVFIPIDELASDLLQGNLRGVTGASDFRTFRAFPICFRLCPPWGRTDSLPAHGQRVHPH